MNLITTGIGILVLGYGIFSGIMRIVKPGLFRKLEPMKEKFGPAAGSIIHFIAYALVPVVAGDRLDHRRPERGFFLRGRPVNPKVTGGFKIWNRGGGWDG